MTTQANDDAGFYDHMFPTLWLCETVQTAVHLGKADTISPADDAGSTSEQLARKFGWSADIIYRLMRALSANGIFAEQSGKRFVHTERSRLLRSDHPRSQRAMFLLQGAAASHAAWRALPEAAKTGKPPFEVAHGTPLFPYMAQHRDLSDTFNMAMVQYTKPMVQALLEAYPQFNHIASLCDVGGGLGQLLAGLLQGCPTMEGAVFDLPGLKASSLDYLATAGVGKRTQFIGGSFLETIPAGYQAYIIKNCLWNWNDADVRRILGHVSKALGEAGKLFIVESLITPETAPYSTLMDLQMLVLPNGRSRTLAEYQTLLTGAGMRISSTVRVGLEHTLLECVRS